jgi:hypothetical protein
MQMGGGVLASSPPVACLGVLPGCAGIDACTCLASPPAGACGPSDVVANLCVCDAGIR